MGSRVRMQGRQPEQMGRQQPQQGRQGNRMGRDAPHRWRMTRRGMGYPGGMVGSRRNRAVGGDARGNRWGGGASRRGRRHLHDVGSHRGRRRRRRMRRRGRTRRLRSGIGSGSARRRNGRRLLRRGIGSRAMRGRTGNLRTEAAQPEQRERHHPESGERASGPRTSIRLPPVPLRSTKSSDTQRPFLLSTNSLIKTIRLINAGINAALLHLAER